MDELIRIRAALIGITARLSWLPPALARLTLGIIFIGSGWGKLHNLEKMIEFFTQLRIPVPAFSAPFVGATELVCGSLLLLGLASRLAAIPLIVTMCVAIATARIGDVEGFGDLLRLQEVDYMILSIWIAVAGAGALSLDYLLSRRLRLSETR